MTPELLNELERLEREATGNEARPIPSFPGYAATSEGHILSFHNWRGEMPHRMRTHLDRYGYHKVHLKCGAKESSRQVHRLVCAAFYGERPNRQAQVRHLDGDKNNNSATNLCWGTAKENAEDRDRHGRTARGERNGEAKLSDADVMASAHLIGRGVPLGPVATWLNVDCTTLRRRIAALRNSADSLIAAARKLQLLTARGIAPRYPEDCTCRHGVQLTAWCPDCGAGSVEVDCEAGKVK